MRVPHHHIWISSLIILTVLLGACAEERDPINRVQPYALKKAFFVGEDLTDPSDNPEFWTQNTLVDVGYGASQDGLFTSTYAQPVARMRWFITEDLLIGRASYERIDGSDGKGVGDKTDEGIIVAAFKIQSHFDVVNSYNSTTGEKLNVLEENTYDRPWYEREYMRVDWSQNLNTDSYDFDTLSLVGIYGGVDYEPLSYYVDDPSHDDAPVFDMENGYFDVTTKAFAKPGVVDLSHLGWGIDSFPACYLDNDFFGGSAPVGNCNPVELTLRHSFRKVVDDDFEPREWDGYRFQAAGAFYTERYGYARNYGMTDEMWHRLINGYQIWERSHYYKNPEKMTGAVECFVNTPYGMDPHRDDNNDGTEDECAAVGKGSRCDTFTQKCTLPFQQREEKPVVWYYTVDSDPEYFEATEMAAHQWDVALRTAVQTARLVECKRIGGDAAACDEKYPMYHGQDTDNMDAMNLALEMDDCRNGVAYSGAGGDQAKCAAEIKKKGEAWGVGDGVIAIAQMPEMIVLCHSPVQYNDHPLCGEARLTKDLNLEACKELKKMDAEEMDDAQLADLDICQKAITVRKGDLRYNQVNVIPEPQTPSPWGIMVDSIDPLNGQTISTSVNVWGWVADYWSQLVIDQLRYIKGELKTEEITEGKYIHNWSMAAEAAAGDGASPQLTQNQVSMRMSEFTKKNMADAAGFAEKFKNENPAAYKLAREVKSQLKGVMADASLSNAMAPIYLARASAARGSEVEAQLMNRMMQQLYGVENLVLSDSLMNMVSPLRGGNPSLQREFSRMKENALANRGVCILQMADAPMALAAFADVLESKFGAFNPNESKTKQMERAEKMRKYVAQRAHTSVIVHEMGHSIGLRHNFVSSSDAWNFRPQYWQLRTKNGKVSKLCEDLSETGEDCVGPRWFDPITTEEKSNLIQMFMHFSVMEYAGETLQDFMGLGTYDFQATQMFYGDVASVYMDESYRFGTDRSNTVMQKLDNFGGILGFSHSYKGEDIHYSMLQKDFDLIRDCVTLTEAQVENFKPARYNEEAFGKWNPVVDGMIVKVDGSYSRCRQQPVDYVAWNDLRSPGANELDENIYYRAGPSIDPEGRVRFPFGFGTDNWADIGNSSVYRHDNGADTYEIFNFMITQQEVNHIFDNYRRGRPTFSVRSAAGRTLGRFNEKMRDGAKGLGLMKNVYKDVAMAVGYDFDGFWAGVAPIFFGDNIISSSMVFDHFARTLARPQAGPHYREGVKPVLYSTEDAYGDGTDNVQVVVPNGATGKYGKITLGGKPIHNMLSENNGEYDSSYTMNCGSYYDKVYASMLFTESVDNFISDSRGDFIDARYRAVSLADVFPEGYRRLIANMLTGDEFIKGTRIAALPSGMPMTDSELYPKYGIGWTSWWGDEPTTCFPAKGSTICGAWNIDSEPFEGQEIQNVTVLDSQVGWEEQKFLIAWTLMYLPENQQQTWIDMMQLWELGADSDPGFENRIEFHNPTGKVYVAKTFGQETIFGKVVQRGIAARILEYANDLMAGAYEVEDGPDLNGDGNPDWFYPVMNPETGLPIVKYDPTVKGIDGPYEAPFGVEGCNAESNVKCTCTANRSCVELSRYLEIPFFLRQTMAAYGLVQPSTKGIWD